MDDPHHRKVRAIGADWFRPKAMRDLKVRVDELAKRYVDRMRDIGPECDFVTEIAVNFPLYVIMSLLGLPEEDFPRMHKLTQEMFGGDDDEYNKRGGTPEEQLAVLLDFFAYFSQLTASRREHPTEDLASAIANGRIDGEPLSDVDTASYYVIVASAGHDTTKDAISGGLLALIENPGELTRLREDPDLMRTAVEEMIRWTTPVKEFMRTAAEDTTVRGVPIAKGESVYLAYVSGNRDEEVFDDPFRFDVGRDPNKHVAFGYGVHFCLGAALARMEMNSLYTELVPRLEVHRVGGRARTGRHHVRRRTQAPADSLLVAVAGGPFLRWVARKPSTAATAHLAIVEIGERRQPSEDQRAEQQGHRLARSTSSSSATACGLSKSASNGAAYCSVMRVLRVPTHPGARRASRVHAGDRGPMPATSSPSTSRAPRRSSPPNASTTAISRSRSCLRPAASARAASGS